jgi:hypothetical protein
LQLPEKQFSEIKESNLAKFNIVLTFWISFLNCIFKHDGL